MRFPLIAAVALLASGCSIGPKFNVKPAKQTCGEDFLTWTGGLTYDVMQGTGDGNFNYRPLGTDTDARSGAYDLKTGEFWWDNDYREGHWRSSQFVRNGIGMIWRDGDLDIQYDWQVAFADGRGSEGKVRQQRFGCDEGMEVADNDGSVIEQLVGEYTGGEFAYTRDFFYDGVAAQSSGVRRSDGTYEESISQIAGGTALNWFETGDNDGNVTREDIEITRGTDTIKGSYTMNPDEGISYTYRVVPLAGNNVKWTYTVDAVGNGGGLLEYGDNSCTLLFAAGECARTDCTDGNDGACSPPLSADLR